MNKAEGKKIAIKFTLPLLPLSISLVDIADSVYSVPLGVVTYSNQYSTTYSADKAFDNSDSTYWQTRATLPQWVAIELSVPRKVAGFRMYSGSSYRPNAVKLYGSNDGSTFDLIAETTNANSTGWKAHTFDAVGPYKYYKWEVVSTHTSGRVYVYELQLLFTKSALQSGNEDAFTITGKEYQYTDGPDNNGPLIDKAYEVETVEMYGVVPIWRGESLTLDLPGEMSITDAQCYTDTGITSLTGTVYANDGDIVLATATHRGAFTPPDGWEFLYESATIGTVNQRMIVYKKYVDESGLVSFTGKQNISQSMYLNLISVSGISDIIFAPELESIYRGGVKPAPMPDKQEGEKIIWGATVSVYATSSPYGGWSTTPDDLTIIHLDQSSYAPRLVNLIDFGDGQTNNRTIMQSPNTTGTDVNIAGFKVIQNYSTPKIYTSQAIQLDGEYRLRWIENKPENTDILIEYTTGETQGQWQEVSNGDVITSDTNLWFRITLETTDTSVTPTLQDLWIEEPEAPPDTIRLLVSDTFRNAQGNLTVSYNQAFGNLAGTGGPVGSFEQSFLPTELTEGISNSSGVGMHEHIEASVDGTIELVYITKSNAYAQVEHITASVSGTVELIDASIINP